MAAAATVEYYPLSNCGLLGYLVVDESFRGQKLANQLLEHSRRVLIEEEMLRTNWKDLYEKLTQSDNLFLEKQLQYLNLTMSVEDYVKDICMNFPLSLFCECENSHTVNEVMDPKIRHKIYSKLGFGLLKFRYIQRLSLSDEPMELLLLFQPCYGDKQSTRHNNESRSISLHNMATYVFEYYKATYYCLNFPTIDDCYDTVMKSLVENTSCATEEESGKNTLSVIWNVDLWD